MVNELILNYVDNKETILSACVGYSLFFQENFCKYIEFGGDKKYYIYYHAKLDSYLAFIVEKSRFIKLIRLIGPPVSKIKIEPKTEEQILNDFVSFCRKNAVGDKISYYLPFEVFQSFPKGSTLCETGHLEVNLCDHGVEYLFETLFKSKVKNMIRKAQKSGVEIRTGNGLFDHFYNLYADTNKRSKGFIDSYTDLKNLLEYMKDNATIFVAYANQTPQSAAFILHDTNKAYYLLAGTITPIVQGSTNLLQFEIMKYLKEKGIHKYLLGGMRLKNMENTKYEGIQKFKISLGSEVNYGYLWKISLSPLKCFIYNALLKIKLRINGIDNSLDFIDSQK